MTDGIESRTPLARRRLLGLGLGLAAGLAPAPLWAALPARTRTLDFRHLHTGEVLSASYWRGGDYDPKALARIDDLLRDFRTDDVHPIDPRLLDLLYRLKTRLGSRAEVEVVSAYRSPRTNAMLARHGTGVAKKSLHMRGMAIDIRLPSHDAATVYGAAKRLHAGGSGLYRRAGFVHLDIGRPRYW